MDPYYLSPREQAAMRAEADEQEAFTIRNQAEGAISAILDDVQRKLEALDRTISAVRVNPETLDVEIDAKETL